MKFEKGMNGRSRNYQGNDSDKLESQNPYGVSAHKTTTQNLNDSAEINNSMQYNNKYPTNTVNYDPQSCKSQQSQSFVMDNSICHLNNPLDDTNNYSVGAILDSSILENATFQGTQLKKGSNYQKQVIVDGTEEEEIVVPSALAAYGTTNQQSDPAIPSLKQSQRKKLPPIITLTGKDSKIGAVGATVAVNQSINIDDDSSKQMPEVLMYRSESSTSLRMHKPQATFLQKVFRKCELRSSVTAMCILFVMFFAVQLILETSTSQRRPCTAYKIGAQFQPAVTNGGEVHRLFISSLLHASWLHIVSSVFTLLFYGFVLERHYGLSKMIMLYVTCAFSGNIFAGLINPYDIQIGPNSIIMGIFTLQVVFLYQIRHRIPKSKKKPIIGMFILLLLTNFLCIIESPTVQASSYLGGILSGVLLGVAYYKPQISSKSLEYTQKAAYGLVAILNIIVFSMTMATSLYAVQVSDEIECSTTSY